MSYYRVIPRDFFNEAKLLKCLGAFELRTQHTGGVNMLPFQTEHDGDAFQVVQDPHDASLFVSNYIVTLRGDEVHLYVPYNNEGDPFPLYAEYQGKVYKVLDDEGRFLWSEQ